MKRLSIAIVLLLVPSAVLAQVPGDDTGTPPPPPPPLPEPEAEPPPPPQPKLAPAVEPEPEPAPVSSGERPTRPESNSIALGLGWNFPADLQAPNITSVRFRLPSGLTFEPSLRFSRATSRVDNAVPPDDETKTTNLEVFGLARQPIMQNGKVDFELLGGGGLSRLVIDPDMADNNTTRTTFTLAYGLAVGYWFSPHFYLTLTGVNPIFTTTKEDEEMGPTTTVGTSSSSVGLVFQPDIFAMVHLYL